MQDCFEQQGELLQGDVHQLPCKQTLAVTVARLLHPHSDGGGSRTLLLIPIITFNHV